MGSGLHREPAVSAEDPTHSTEKQTPTLIAKILCKPFEAISNPHRTLARGSESVFQWDVWICVGSSAETAESLRNPETRGTPSYVRQREKSKFKFGCKKVVISYTV